MLQRIQTIYLIIVLLLLGGFLYFPIAEVAFANSQPQGIFLGHSFLLKATATLELFAKMSMILAWLLIGMNFITIFMYKNRKIQMFLCLLSSLLLMVLTLVAGYFLWKLKLEAGSLVYYKITIFLPFLGAFSSYLAYRGIKKDDQLVKSYDRLR